MESIDKLSEIILARYSDRHVGYKKCQDDRIVVLEIIGKNNEDREGIIDKNFAKMRCSEAKVLMIVDMYDPNKTFKSANSIYVNSFVYRIYETVKPEYDYYVDNRKVCESGIHYFLTIKPSFYWNIFLENGQFESWHENGQIEMRYICRSGEKYGLCEKWYYNGQMKKQCNYKDGKKDGLCISWYHNGNIYYKYTCKYGYIDGLFESWYINGQIYKRCTYKDGKCTNDGKYTNDGKCINN